MTSWLLVDLLDHLWQSTLFAGAVWLLAHALRANHARVRYRLWLAASMKFLIPVSALVGLGEQFAWRPAPAMAATPTFVTVVVDQVLTPTASISPPPTVDAASASALIPTLVVAVWAIGLGWVLVSWWRQWVLVKSALRYGRPVHVSSEHGGGDLRVVASRSMIEPGVFGIWRPVLVVPEGITERLSPAQLRAVIAHERCHLGHRDNLTIALHMAIEALFWFHPVVWWIERRLLDERERACDEYVLQSGSSPRDYAEGILEVCRFVKEALPPCVAGVTGSDLRRRIEAILSNDVGRALTFRRRAALAFLAGAAMAGPIALGAAQAAAPAQGASAARPEFEVAAIRRTVEGASGVSFGPMPGGRLRAVNNPVSNFIGNAYDVPFYRIANLPDWATSERYNLEAKAADAASGPQMMQMLQTLLEDRFKLTLHRETRDGPVYVLSVARGGSRLRESQQGSCIPFDPSGPAPPQSNEPRRVVCGNNLLSRKGANIAWNANHVDMQSVARALASFTRRTVIDKTGITGFFDIDIELPPLEPAAGIDDPAAAGPSAFTVLREQLGLTLAQSRGPVEYLVIDRLERPTEN